MMKDLTNVMAYTKEDSEDDRYPEFEIAVRKRFEKFVSNGALLFSTNADDIFETYLENLPKEAQAHYVCNSCKSFFTRYGNLVTIDPQGNMESVLWNHEDVPSFFKKSVKALEELVLASSVKKMFISDEKTLGHPVTGSWTHLSVTLPISYVNKSRLLTASQLMAEKVEDYKMLMRAVVEFNSTTVDKALALIKSETMYRSDRVLGIAEWFKNVIELRASVSGIAKKTNVTWLAVASAPNGYTHIKSSMIGTLLEDIQSGLNAELVASRFAEKMNPANYMRSQTAPTQGGIYEAEKIIQKLGLENSLSRRYATLEELPESELIWKERKFEPKKSDKPAGIFAHLAPKQNVEDPMMLPQTIMTFDKFSRTVLPTADKIEAMISNPERFMALVTAEDNTAENILQWGNPFSWYYHGGADAEMKRRVEEAGGRHEDNTIRVSLMWEGLTDLDLHCVNPRGQHLYYHSKRDSYGGYLDLDMNGLDRESSTPVENMRWGSNAPEGKYKFYVVNYSERVNRQEGTPFVAELEVNGRIYKYHGKPLRDGKQETVFEFDFSKSQGASISSASTNSDDWGVRNNSFVKVNAIIPSPNLWGEDKAPQAGNHTFFLLDGVKDTSEGKGRGFFNEMLKGELRQIRKTLEAFTASAVISDSDSASACGLGYSKDSEWNLILKVTSGNSSRLVKIDRWD